MMPTPPLAYHDRGFVDSDEGRPIRIVSEYLAPLRAFNAAGVTATVVFFGSARVRVGGPLGRYLEEAMELARLVTEWSRSLPGERTQTRKLDRSIPVFLYGSAFWKEVVNFEALVRHGTIAAADLRLFEFVDEPRAAFELIKAGVRLAPQPKPASWFAK